MDHAVAPVMQQELDSAMNAQFRINVVQVNLDCVLRNVEGPCDLLVGLPKQNSARYRVLSGCKLGEVLVRLRVRECN